jgi:hypothetical protein
MRHEYTALEVRPRKDVWQGGGVVNVETGLMLAHVDMALKSAGSKERCGRVRLCTCAGARVMAHHGVGK